MGTYQQESTYASQAVSKKAINENLKAEQVDKDSGVYDRITYSVCQSSHCPSDCSRVQSNASPNTTSSSAYSSVTSSYCGHARRKSEAAAARLFIDSPHFSRVPHHPLVTGSPMELYSADGARTVATLAVPCMHSKRSRGESSLSKIEHTSSDDSRCLYNSTTNTTYEKKRLLGKGGFARVYEVSEVNCNLDSISRPIMAAKVINKSRISRPHQREKVDLEVELMEEVRGHPNIVNLLESFEDEQCICILLELCRKKSLAQYLRRKQCLSESEVCHIMQQIVSGLSHLHGKGIIHRDLKLGNILLTENMQVKIGDFGLATRAEWDRKKTICGTPNFIAPEVLQRQGHGPESDIWALGCLLYTLLVGKPPFETSSLKETYRHIIKNNYRVPSTVSAEAADLIRSMLRLKPKTRPTVDEIASHPFFLKYSSVKPTLPKLSINSIKETPRKSSNIDVAAVKSAEQSNWSASNVKISHSYVTETGKETNSRSIKNVAKSIRKTFNKMSLPMKAVAAALKDNKKTSKTTSVEEEINQSNNNNNSITTRVNKWVDYSNRYGFGYQLMDGKISVLFNDGKHLSLLPGGKTVEYAANKLSKIIRFPVDAAPPSITKYANILNNFTVYMDKTLNAGSGPSSELEQSSGVRLLTWNRTKEFIAMYFSDGTIQINFTDDHVKVNINLLHKEAEMRAVVVDTNGQLQTFTANQIVSQGSVDLIKKLDAIHQQLHLFVDVQCSNTAICRICKQIHM